jgi:hypothetical protein
MCKLASSDAIKQEAHAYFESFDSPVLSIGLIIYDLVHFKVTGIYDVRKVV